MAQTEYTLLDDYFPLVYTIKLRPGARLVQVWHALGAFKRVGYSRLGKGGGPDATSLAHRNYTDVIVSADAVRENYAEAFGVELSAVHATGIPRSDLFFDPEERQAITEVMLYEMPFLQGRRLIFFVPTFRGRAKRTAHYPEQFMDYAKIGAALGENDLLVIKMHPFVRKPVHIPEKYADKIVDLSTYPEFNHLLLLCDVLITDYSSAIFDYALLHRPVIFFVPDLDTYADIRGFYYPFEEYTYGPVVRDMDGLIEALRSAVVDEDRLGVFCEKFLNRCDGHATQRFIDTVFQSRLPGK